jgi:hypothetical protein
MMKKNEMMHDSFFLSNMSDVDDLVASEWVRAVIYFLSTYTISSWEGKCYRNLDEFRDGLPVGAFCMDCELCLAFFSLKWDKIYWYVC